ncbi:protein FAM234A-like isoform X2 [Cynocephalus volans]|uniref:protein FAM234A-like isoform X2 n=1 Tax=Cynocephalus volans TaxID=110931 RepID=UPI002FC6F91D
MDNKDLEAEIHPLKNEDRKSQENLGNQSKNEDNLKSMPPQSRLSRCRTVAFFLSLFICLFVVFVVSFIIPCPDRPVSQGMWRVDYNAAVTYDFLAMEDVNRDRIQDILFLYKDTNSSNTFNRSCADEGETLWSRPSSFGRNASILSPLLQVPDIDGDGAPDLLILTQEEKEVNGHIYSGSTGHQIGHRGSLGVAGESGSLLHVTRTGAHYVLFPCEGSLCGCSVEGLYEKVTGRDGPFKKDPHWENMLNATTHRMHLHSSGVVRYLMSVPGKAGKDVLLVSSEACELLDGQELVPRWTFHASQVLRKPILGHYRPDALAVVIENGTGIDRQILLLDLSSGAMLWTHTLPSLPGGPPSSSLPTADHRSAFFFWGLHEMVSTNEMETGAAQHSLYMFHPTLPRVLLELANVSANVIAFNVVLFEPSRHAAYVLLTGPVSSDVPGLVSVTKHKVQDLVPGSRVVRLGEGRSDSDQAIRDRFTQLRYRSEA